jgi:processive 1,2-diacylglycerol beta-glucosyltransferase
VKPEQPFNFNIAVHLVSSDFVVLKQKDKPFAHQDGQVGQRTKVQTELRFTQEELIDVSAIGIGLYYVEPYKPFRIRVYASINNDQTEVKEKFLVFANLNKLSQGSTVKKHKQDETPFPEFIDHSALFFTPKWRGESTSWTRVEAPLTAVGWRIELSEVPREKIFGHNLIVVQREFPALYPEFCQKLLIEARKEKIPIVYESNDNLINVPVYHAQYLLLQKERNAIIDFISAVDFVVAATTPLCERLRMINENVLLLPDFLDVSVWSQEANANSQSRQNESKTRILYVDEEANDHNLQMLAPVLKRLSEKYGDRLAVEILGPTIPSLLRQCANVRWHPKNWTTYFGYANKLSSLGADVAVWPLTDNHFERCKSNIRSLELSWLGVPGIYSPSPSVKNVIQHEMNGFFADNEQEWFDYCSMLIDSHSLRKTIRESAKRTVSKTCTLQGNLKKVADTFNTILRATPV